MDRKKISKILDQNISFLIVGLSAVFMSMLQLENALSTLENGILNNFHLSVFMIKLDVTSGTYNHIYEIGNYPLIPIVGGLIYNIYKRVMVVKSKD